MRKKQRYTRNGALIAASAFVIIDGLNQYLKLKEEGKPFWENLDVPRSLNAGASGLLIGGVAGYLLYEVHKWEEKDLPFCPDNHLHGTLNVYNAQGNPSLKTKAKKIINDLKEKVSFYFGNELVMKPLDFGSAKTKTAIGGSSDFDILVPFQNRIVSLTDKADELLDFISDKYSKKNFEVRKQRHSIGLIYDDGECSIHIDVVPAKERNNIRKTGDVTILRRGLSFWETDTYVKSNIWIKRKILVNQPEARRIIKLMKIYRDQANLEIKSPVIIMLVKEAMKKNKGYINSSIYNNLTLTMGYIADQLQWRTKISDAANTNNNLLEKMPEGEREAVANLIISDLEKLEESPQYLKEIFEIE